MNPDITNGNQVDSLVQVSQALSNLQHDRGARKTSYLSTRRPPPLQEQFRKRSDESHNDSQRSLKTEVSSPEEEEDGGIRTSLEIDMKGLVGDAVGNVSRYEGFCLKSR
jgi:hypothetical protein